MWRPSRIHIGSHVISHLCEWHPISGQVQIITLCRWLCTYSARNNTKEIQQELSNELESIREWLIYNKLSLHLGKTESILFASKRKLQKYNSIQVQCVGNVLTCWTKVKYLGVELVQSLAGDCMPAHHGILSWPRITKLSYNVPKTKLFDIFWLQPLGLILEQMSLDW